ncbi:MAG TPA: TetR family transcriptional regulator C-terminal domain-containing protein [Hyphomonadaceae bacterium]|jgi:TetR/AcrR family transcriptional repressor of bet genes
MARKQTDDARRVQLLEATIESISRQGFAKTTHAGIAKAAGIPVVVVREFFPTTRDLFVETLRHMALVYEASWRERVYRQTTPYARLSAMIEADFDPLMSDREGAIVWYGFWREAQWRPELRHVCEKLSRAYFEQSWTALRQLIEEGGYRDLDPVEMAHSFNAMINGLWIEILINPEGCDVALAKRTLSGFLARAFPREASAWMALSSAA